VTLTYQTCMPYTRIVLRRVPYTNSDVTTLRFIPSVWLFFTWVIMILCHRHRSWRWTLCFV